MDKEEILKHVLAYEFLDCGEKAWSFYEEELLAFVQWVISTDRKSSEEPEAWYDKNRMLTHDPLEGVLPLYFRPASPAMPKLTKDQAAIIGCFTGVACGPFSDIHEKAESLLGHPVWTHEFANKELMAALREAARDEFLGICYEEEEE